MAVELLNTVSIVSLAYLAVTFVASYLVALLIGRKLSWIDRLVLWWIVWDGVVHLTVEGPFVALSLFGKVNDSSSLIAQPWKEYSKADARYLVSDPLILSIELLTVVILTPVCVILAYAISQQSPFRHWLQLVLCTCELYGGWMTFAPELLTGGKNLTIDNWLYLWVYLVFCNGLWVVMPVALMYQSFVALTYDPKRRKPSTAARRSESPKATNQRNDALALAGGDQAKKRKTRRKQY